MTSSASGSTTPASSTSSSSSTSSTAGSSPRKAGCCGWPRIPGSSAPEFLREYFGNELGGRLARARRGAARPRLAAAHRKASPRRLAAARQDRPDRGRSEAADRRVPPRRADRAARRARGRPGQEGDGRGQSAARHLDRQEIHQSRAAIPRPDPGRQYRPDEGGRQIRVPPRLQILDLCDLVDPPGDHPLDRRPGAHHPHPGAHDRDDQQAGAHLAPDAARDRPRADPRGARRKAGDAAWKRCARC